MSYNDPDKQKKAQNESYLRNKEKVRESSRFSRRTNTQVIWKLKESTPCADCKQRYPHYVMDFDHRPGTEKIAGVSRLARSAGMDTLMAEVSKCDIVCANCHRERSYQAGHWDSLD